MKRKEQVLSLLKQHLPFLKQTFKVKSIAIFGSYSREEQTEKSDIDLLVEFEAPVGGSLNLHINLKRGTKRNDNHYH